MPSVDVAMARSLRGGIWGSLTQSLESTLRRRDTIGDMKAKAGEAVNAFSSWDRCMKATYCKWPVIAIIVIGGLILIGIVWGIIRCACCGLSCCCSCCNCLKCCGQCCGLCDPPKGKAHRYLDNETVPPNHGYRSEPPMKAPLLSPGPLSHGPRPGAVGHHAASEPPQYAEFDVSRKGGEDSLPAMPSWQDAASKKVLVEDAHEMDQLKKPEAAAAGSALAVGGAAGAVAAGALSAGHSSHNSPAISPGRNPYGQPSPAGSNGHFQQGQQPQASPYGAGNDGYNYANNPSLGVDQYGAAAAMGPARHSPHPPQPEHRDYNNGYQQDQGYGSRSHSPHVYGGQGGYGAPQGQGYGARQPSPPMNNGYGNDQMRRSPAPRGDFGYEQQHQYSQDQGQGGYGYNNQHSPQRQYSGDSRQPQYANDGYDAGLQNNSGFDFNSGYSRPHQLDSPNSNNTGRRPSPPRQQPSDPGYQAYRPYQPPGGGY